MQLQELQGAVTPFVGLAPDQSTDLRAWSKNPLTFRDSMSIEKNHFSCNAQSKITVNKHKTLHNQVNAESEKGTMWLRSADSKVGFTYSRICEKPSEKQE